MGGVWWVQKLILVSYKPLSSSDIVSMSFKLALDFECNFHPKKGIFDDYLK